MPIMANPLQRTLVRDEDWSSSVPFEILDKVPNGMSGSPHNKRLLK